MIPTALRIASTLLLVALLASAQTPIGTGHSPVAEAGPGVDLVVWHDGASIRAARVGADGSLLDVSPLTLGPASTPIGPQVAWDGQAFVVVWADGDAIRARRVGADASLGALSSFGPITPPHTVTDLAIAADGAGSARVWTAPFHEIFIENGVIQPPLGAGERDGTVADAAVEWSVDRWSFGWIGRGSQSQCAVDPGCLFLPGSTGLRIVTDSAMPGTLTSTSRDGAVFGWASIGDPAEFHLIRPWPGPESHSILRLPFPLRLQNGTSLYAVGGRARVRLDEELHLREATLFDIEEGESVATLLPHSGFVVSAPSAGTGPLVIRTPSSNRFDIAISPVFLGSQSVWLKIENRGPDAPEGVHLWVGARVSSFSSLSGGEILERGAISLIRFDGIFHRGAGYEVVLAFDEPIDSASLEAWTFAEGTDLDATNNRVGPAIEEPEPAPEPARRRIVGRTGP